MKFKAAWIGYGMYAGGAESNAIHIAHYFSKKHISLDFILLDDVDEYKKRYKKLYKSLKFFLIFKKRNRYISRLLYPFYLLFSVIKFIKIISKNEYDILLSMVEYEPSFLTVVLAKILHKKSIVIVGQYITQDIKHKTFFKRYFYRFLLEKSLAWSDSIVCVSHGLMNHLIAKYGLAKSKIKTVYNGINFREIRKYTHINKTKEYRIATLGRLVENKNYSLLIDAISTISRTLPIKLMIIGKGDNKNTLSAYVNKKGLNDIIEFKNISKKDPLIDLKRSDLFVFTSKYEGFGNVILEAMACGLPVISMNCFYGPQEILTDNFKYKLFSGKINDQVVTGTYGVLIHYSPSYEQNVTALSNTIQMILRNKQLLNHYKKMSLKRVSDFSTEKMSNQYLSIASSLVIDAKQKS